jgi:hypothetical protein
LAGAVLRREGAAIASQFFSFLSLSLFPSEEAPFTLRATL